MTSSRVAPAAGEPPPIEVRRLTKRYGDIVAVDGVDLTVPRGGVYGYLGPNGAGKTTTLRMLFGLIRPTEGSVRLFGRDPLADPVRALAGVAGFVETPRFYPYLSGRGNLRLLAALDGGDALDRIEEALATVELADRASDRVGTYSFGMRQRLGIAASLLRAPRLLVVDEPTTGLDPAGQRDMKVMIRRLASEGMTVLFSSHLLAEVEEVCDRVAIARRGRIVFEGSIAELRRTATGGYRLWTTDDTRAVEICRDLPGVSGVEPHAGELRFRAEGAAIEAVSIALAQANVAITALIPETITLESLYFELTEPDDPAAARV